MSRKSKDHKYYGTDGRKVIKQERDNLVLSSLENELKNLEKSSAKALSFPKSGKKKLSC